MFINPLHTIQENWITGLTDAAKQVQPNAIDFTLDILQEVNYTDVARISETDKQMRSLLPVRQLDGHWILRGGQVYDGTSNVYIEVPKGAAAILFTRSTFARNGIFIVSGLYDSGYKGHIGFTIYPVGGQTLIAPGTRIGQIALISADAAKEYTGSYNHSAGTHYTEQAAAPVAPATPSFPSTMPQGAGTSTVSPVVVPSGPDYVDPPIGGARPSGYPQGPSVGQRQIPSDPRRTETGMGPMIGGKSDYI